MLIASRIPYYLFCFFFFQAEDGIRDLVRSRGLGDVYKRQLLRGPLHRNRIGFVEQVAMQAQQAEMRLARRHQVLSLIHI